MGGVIVRIVGLFGREAEQREAEQGGAGCWVVVGRRRVT